MPIHKKPYNKTFEDLVQDEADVVGLLAYALYKYDKRSQIIDFQREHQRNPSPREINKIVSIIGNTQHLNFYMHKSNNLLDAAVDYLSEHSSEKAVPVVESLPLDETSNLNIEPENMNSPNQSATPILLGWIPKWLRPIIAIIFVFGLLYITYKQFIKSTPKEMSPCENFTIAGEIDSPNKTRLKKVSIENATYAEDVSIIDGKFEIQIDNKPNEITLIVEYERPYKCEHASILLKKFLVDSACRINVGHQKSI